MIKNLDNMNLVMMEAGGDAVRSSLIFLNDLKITYGITFNPVFIDMNPKSLYDLKEFLGCGEYHVQGNINRYLTELNNFVVMPVDEYGRNHDLDEFSENNYACELTNELVELIHNKKSCYSRLMDQGFENYLPDTYSSVNELLECNPESMVVVRRNKSAGSKGLLITKVKDIPFGILQEFDKYIITEYINDTKEYVVDYVCTDDNNLSIFPRQTTSLKNGADTYVKLLSNNSDEFKIIDKFMHNIILKNHAFGIGMIQVLIKNGRLYFIEWGLRLSGSSYVNLDVMNNNLYEIYSYGKQANYPDSDIMYSTKFNRFINIKDN